MTNEFEQIFYMNPALREAALEARMDLPGKEQLVFMGAVTEAVGTSESRSKLINALYQDVSKIKDIDLSKIDSSRGDISKYRYYTQLYASINSIEDLCGREVTPNIETLLKLHNILLNSKQDFIFGYKVDNFIIMSTYKIMMAALYEMVQICAVDCTANLRKKLSVKDTTKTMDAQNNIVIKNVNRFIKQYESGEWFLLMKVFKANHKELSIANESFDVNINIGKGGSNDVTNLLSTDTGGAIKKISGIVSELPGADAFTKIMSGKGVKILGVALALLLTIRALVWYFFKTAFTVNEYARTNSDILKANIANNDNPGVEDQKKTLSILGKVSDFITYKIFKVNKETAAEMKVLNKESFSPEIIRTANASFEL